MVEDSKRVQVQVLRTDDQWEIMQNPAFEEAFVKYRDQARVQYVFLIPSIHCRACVWLLEKLPSWVEGVSWARVNLDQGLLEVEAMPREGQFVDLVRHLDRLGYSPDLHPTKNRGDGSSLELRRQWMMTGVAGFCFGNVMLFSFPEYLGGEALGDGFENVFRWLCLIFALPTFFYSSSSIFRSAFLSFKEWKPSVDIPIALGIIVLFVWSCTSVILGRGTPYFDSLCGLVFFLLVGRSYQRKSFTHLVFERDNHRFFPLSLSVIRKGKREAIPLSELKCSDHYFLKSGGLVPVRSHLVKGEGVFDFRMVTGETEPQLKHVEERVHAGGIQRGGEILLEAEEDLDESELVRMWGGGEERPSRREEILDRISGVFTLVILSLSGFTFYWHGMDGEALHRACAILIVACPCALALSAPLTLGKAIRALADRGCFVRYGAMIETLAETDHVVFDKTGTLTHIDRMSGEWSEKPLGSSIEPLLALIQQSGHPVAQSLKVALEDMRSNTQTSPEDSVEHFMEHPGKGMEAMVAGKKVRVGSRVWISGQAGSGVCLELDGEIVGVYNPRSLLRDGILDSLESLKEDGVGLSLLSGDHNRDEELLRGYLSAEEMHFECSPEVKARKIREKVEAGKRVAMVGDGLNDSLAMKSSHLGIAVPLEDGCFAPNSDVIIQESELRRLHEFRKFCRLAVRNIWVCLTISLLYNMLGFILAFSGRISPMVCAVLMPISALTILIYSVGWTGLLAKRFFGRGQ